MLRRIRTVLHAWLEGYAGQGQPVAGQGQMTTLGAVPVGFPGLARKLVDVEEDTSFHRLFLKMFNVLLMNCLFFQGLWHSQHSKLRRSPCI